MAQVRVTWPDGTVGPWLAAGADHVIEVARDAASVRDWQPTSR